MQISWKPGIAAAAVDDQQDLSKLEDMMYSIQCQSCQGGFPVIIGPGSELSELNPQKCQQCLQRPSQKVLMDYLVIKNNVEATLEKNDLAQGEPESCVT